MSRNTALVAKRSRRRTRPRQRSRARDVVEAFTFGRVGLRHSDSRVDIRRLDRWFASWVYVCIERNATAVTQQVPRLFHRTANTPRTTKALTHPRREYLKAIMPQQLTQDTVEVPHHPFLDLLERPNPILDKSGLFNLTVSFLQATGNSFWQMTYDDEGMPAEIWPLPSQYMTPVFGEERIIDKYEFRMGGKIQHYDASEIVHFRRPSPIDTISDFGNLRGMLETAELDIRMLEYERAVFDNMATPDILISPKGDTAPAQLEALRHDWEQKYKGHRRRGKAAAVPFPIEVTQLSFKNRDLEFEKGKISVRDKLAAGFGVPIPILTSTSTTFSNMDVGVQLWMRNTIQPLTVLIATTINHQVMPSYEPREDDGIEFKAERPQWFIAFDNPVPEDIDSQAVRDASDVGAGLYTINEVRERRGDEPVPWGDEPFMLPGLLTPTQIAEQQEMHKLEAEMSAAGDGDEAPTYGLGELTTAYSVMADRNDVDGCNLIREQIGQIFGATLSPVSDIRPAPSAPVVNPDEAVEPNIPEPKREESNGTSSGQQKPKDSAEGKAATAGSGEGSTGDGEGEQPEDETGGGGSHKDGDDRERSSDDGSGLRKDAGESQLSAEGAGGHSPQAEAIAKRMQNARVKLDGSVVGEFLAGGQQKNLAFILKNLFVEFEADVLEKLQEVIEKSVKTSERKPEDIIKVLFMREKWLRKFAEGALPSLLIAFQTGAEAGAKDLQVAGVEIERLSSEYVERAVQELSLSFASKIVSLTGEQLAEALIPGLQEGENIGELAKRVGDVYGDKKDKHAVLIARTEVNTALNAGATDTWKETGIEKKEWLASSDACEFCRALDGQQRKMGEPFAKMGSTVTGVQGGTMKVKYREIQHPTLHPNCVCTVVPVIE